MIKKLKLFILWVVVSPWVCAILVDKILPRYELAIIANMLAWCGIFMAGIYYFVENIEELKKELRGEK